MEEKAGDRISYRPFLDGLRAVAVLGVLVYHLDRSWLPGGFLGVDVFFVLSGFLITTLLLAERRETGRIHLPSFWARRIRRLLPALLVLLVVMAILIAMSGDLLAQGQARGDLLATLFYGANWRFILSGQSYFTQYVAVSPDRHTWSLAIEEQFYLVWPIVVAAVLARGPRRLRGLVAVAVAGSLASAVAMAFLFDPRDPSRAYYGTDSRVFELLIGALLAMVLAGPYRERALAVGRFVAPAGLAVLFGAYLLLADDNAAYYFGGAAFIALAVAGLIAGLEGGSFLARPLSVRPLVLVGVVSYGLYLWHFPVITFVQQWAGPTSLPGLAAVAVLVTFAVTAASYLLVERPIRRHGRLIRYRLTPGRLLRLVPIASGAVAAVIVFTTVGGIEAPAWDGDALPVVAGVPTLGPVPAGTVAPGSATSSPFADGTGPASPAVPTPSPAGSTPSPAVPTPSPAAPGDPGWTVGVVGDSVMVSAVPGLQAEASSHGWQLLNAAVPACPVGFEPLYDEAGTPSPYVERCRSVLGLHERLAAAHPDVVVWHDLQSSLARRSASGALLLPGTPAWTDDLLAEWDVALGRFLASGAEVVVILPPLRSQAASGCGGVPRLQRCLTIQRQDAAIRAATKTWFERLEGRAGVHLIEVDSLLCPAGYPCPGSVDGLAVRLTGDDQTHFTDAGSRWFAPRLMERVIAAVSG